MCTLLACPSGCKYTCRSSWFMWSLYCERHWSWRSEKICLIHKLKRLIPVLSSQPHLAWTFCPCHCVGSMDKMDCEYTSELRRSCTCASILNWTLLHNYGAAFSFYLMLEDGNAISSHLWRLSFNTFCILVCYVCLKMVLPVAIALILGGALGNLIDRITLGYVVDFIHVYYQNHHFPAFNIADSAITLGTILLLIDTFFLEKQRPKNSDA